MRINSKDGYLDIHAAGIDVGSQHEGEPWHEGGGQPLPLTPQKLFPSLHHGTTRQVPVLEEAE